MCDGMIDSMSADQPSSVFERALGALGHAVIVTDLPGRVTYWNTAAEQLYGFTAEDASGRLAIDLLVPEQARAGALAQRARVLDGEPFTADWQVRDKSGRAATVHATTTALNDDDGQAVAILSVSYEVTAERAMERRASQLAAIVDGSADAIVLTDLEGHIRNANRGVEAVFGYTPEEMVGQDIRMIVPSDRMGEFSEGMAQAGSGLCCETFTTVRLRKGGTPFDAAVRVSPVRDPDGTLVGVSGITRDVTADVQTRKLLEASERHHRARFEQSDMPQAVLHLDGVIVTANDAFCRLLGRGRAELEGTRSQNLWHASDQGDDLAIRRAAQGGSKAETWERILSRQDGTAVPVLVQACVLRDAQGSAFAIECFLQDISEMYRARQELRASEASYRAIVETAQEGIWTADPEGKTRYANGKMAEILGVSLDTILASTVPELLGGADGGAFLAEKLRTRQERGAEQYEVVYPHPDGGARVLRLSVSPLRDDQGATGSLAMITNITDERRGEHELRRRALYDDLTGLPNRSLFTDRLELAVARSERSPGGSVAVLLADLDQFKLVNDSWGHEAADRLLVAVAQRLLAAVRTSDTVARFGGDEFVIIREGVTEVQAQELAARLQRALADPFDLGSHRSYVTASFGVAVSPPSPPEDLLRFADAAMYVAKSRGRGRVRLFDPAMADQADGQLSLSNDLRDALAGDALNLYYQPLVELTTGRVIGVEALARWNHPTRGPVSPVQFVPLAESIGLASTLDRWALGRACRDLGRLRESAGGDLRVSVNLSATHLADADLEESVISTLQLHGLEFSALELEITESAIMDNPDYSRALLQRLRDRGMSIAIDDFGTGYSSLGYLSRLPASTVKIDRSFISNITEDPDSLAIVGSIIDLCRAMRLATVAEGIETVEQLTLLHRLGCTAGQGFLWSAALPLEEFDQLMRRLPNQRFDVTRVSKYSVVPTASPRHPAEPVCEPCFVDSPQARHLSPRERDIVSRLSRGKRVPAIAAELFLTQGTVRNQLSSVYRKLGLSSQQGLLDLIHAAESATPDSAAQRSQAADPERANPIDDGTRGPC
jgi:diguanylate cyclase (GGDEF)-like protein/PAS domain S-box-containing protein